MSSSSSKDNDNDDDDDDDEFGEVNFISTAASKTQEKIRKLLSSKKPMKILETSLVDDSDQSPGEMRRNRDANRRKSKRIVEKQEGEGAVVLLEEDEKDLLNITPPTTPGGVVTRRGKARRRETGGGGGSVRGGKRSQKTTAALKKLQTINSKRKGERKRSQEEDEKEVILISSSSDDDEQTEDPNSLTVKLKWKYEITRKSVVKTERLGPLFDVFCEEKGFESSKNFSFYLRGELLRRDDTAEGLDMDITSIIEVKPKLVIEDERSTEAAGATSVDDENFIELKLRTKDRKSTIVMKIRKTDKMKVLMDKYAEETNSTGRPLKFIFDGENLNPRETPESLDLEGGEYIDVH